MKVSNSLETTELNEFLDMGPFRFTHNFQKQLELIFQLNFTVLQYQVFSVEH